MQQTTPNVNTGIAPLTNVALCLGTLKRAIGTPPAFARNHRSFTASGFGKSTAAACAVSPMPRRAMCRHAAHGHEKRRTRRSARASA